MSKHILSTVFFFSSFSIHAMEVSCPNMTQIRDETSATMQLQVSNHSEHIASFFSTVGASKLCAPKVLAPYEDSDPITVMRKGKTYLNTFTGSFLLTQPKKDNPHKSLILRLLKASQTDDKWSTDKIVVQKMPYEQSYNVIAIVHPYGSVELSSHALQEQMCAEKVEQDKTVPVTSHKEIDKSFHNEEPKIPEYLLNNRIPPQEKLYQAILNDSAFEIELALKNGAHMNFMGGGRIHNPLGAAVELARSNAVEALLKCGANPNSNGIICGPHQNISLVYQAVLSGDIKSALSLVKHGSNFSGYHAGKNVLYYALSFFDNDEKTGIEFIQALIDRRYNIKDSNRDTNIWYLCHYPGGQGRSVLTKNLVQMLVKNGADVNQHISSNETITPLGLAVQELNVLGAQLLLEAGADVNCKFSLSHGVFTPLAYAMHSYSAGQPVNVDMVKLLLQHGADINQGGADRGGAFTPLTYVRRKEFFNRPHAQEVIQLLKMPQEV